MARLTSDIRRLVADRALRAAFEPREKTLALEEDVWARRLYELAFAPKVRTAARSLSDKWVRRSNIFRVNFCGLSLTLRVLGDHLPLPGYSDYDVAGTVSDKSLEIELHKFLDKQKNTKEEKKAAENTLRSMLAAIPTSGKLEEIWPEGREFYKDMDLRKNDLPMIMTSDLNRMLGLAPAEASE